MRKVFACTLIALLAVSAGVVRAEEPTLESVESAIATAWEKVNTYTANMTMDMTVPMGPLKVTSNATGQVEFMRVENGQRFRMEMVNKLGGNMPIPGGAMEQKVLSVYNGELIYNEMEAMGMKKYSKAKPKEGDTDNQVGGKNVVDSMRKQGEVKLLPDEEVNGASAYVFEVTPNAQTKQEGPIKPDKVKFYIAKDSGIKVRTVMLDAAGGTLMTMSYLDIKLNPELDPKRFEYAPPPGVEVVDMGDGRQKRPLF
jgi:outer membrane lipoprotein-sorting protein